MVHTPTAPVRTQPRIRWYRHPWVALALAVLAVILLVTALGLRLVAEAEVAAAVDRCRSWAMFSGLFAFILARATLTEKAQDVLIVRTLTLWAFPDADRTPPPVTPAAHRWAPIAQWVGLVVFLLAGLWAVIALLIELVAYLMGLL